MAHFDKMLLLKKAMTLSWPHAIPKMLPEPKQAGKHDTRIMGQVGNRIIQSVAVLTWDTMRLQGFRDCAEKIFQLEHEARFENETLVGWALH
jgi:hypothetical protein